MEKLALEPFLSTFKSVFLANNWLKCTLSKPGSNASEGLKNVYIRPVDLKKGRHGAATFRYKTRDEVKNFPLDELLFFLKQQLGTSFFSADLFSTEHHHSLQINSQGEVQFTTQKNTQTPASAPSTEHDRSKKRLLDPAAPWLHLLGITNAKGVVLAAHQDKWKQINKYLEIIEALLRDTPLSAGASIADMGSGKGYLTFALYDFLENKMGIAPHITGIELRPALVDFCNKTAQSVGFQRLKFVATDIAQYQPASLHMLIALHACDTATDLALAVGIRQKAQIVVAAPCCHKQIRRDMQAKNELAPLLQHGILLERQAELLTDGIRALLLESEGYRTKVFEFVSSEHTAKNVMITATLDSRRLNQRRAAALKQISALKEGFGIKQHWLEKLLAENQATQTPSENA